MYSTLTIHLVNGIPNHFNALSQKEKHYLPLFERLKVSKLIDSDD